MQTQTGPRTFQAPMPSFMSVFDEDATRREFAQLANVHGPHDFHGDSSLTELGLSPINSPMHAPAGFSVFHQPRGSTSTSASDSTESSPTTTVSTLDGSSLTDPSPGTSPQTPSSNNSMAYAMDPGRFKLPERMGMEPPRTPFFELQRPATPAKKARNLKNLAVNTTSTAYSGRAVASAPFAPPEQSARTSAPSSPTFVKPPTPPRRKLATVGLSIITPANGNACRIGVPPTPSITRPNALRHFQSSPSLPLYTPSSGPVGGMTLPTVRNRATPRGFVDIPIEDEEEEPEPNFDVPQSREEKPESYPNGPIRIYESGIDLYYEPSLEVAAQYDVILNVASEVRNPFVGPAAEKADIKAFSRVFVPLSTFGASDSEGECSPDTPKATPISPQPAELQFLRTAPRRPEYIHIPWEHNTDIVPDLHRLVKLIDERVSRGKRVLVHCQCGVSRSASLIVAYGLYKNPGISVQEAYDAVKKRSKWIGPNMNLIMQLQEFRNSLMRRPRDSGLPYKMPRTQHALSPASPSSPLVADPGSGPQTPRTAPLPPEREAPSNRTRGSSVGPFTVSPKETVDFSFEPLSRRSWDSVQSPSELTLESVSLMSGTPYVDPKGHIVPMLTVLQTPQAPIRPAPIISFGALPEVRRAPSQQRKPPNFSRQLLLRTEEDSDITMQDSLLPSTVSPRAEEFHMAAVVPAPEVESDDTFGILSPIRTEFPQFPLRTEEDSDITMQDSLLPSTVSPRAEEFHMAPVVPAPEVESDDTFGILSPIQTEFPKNPFASAFAAAPAPPARPPPAIPSASIDAVSKPAITIDTLFPLKSPTSTEFPRIDSLGPVDTLRIPPRRGLKTKFSSPNLQERIKLHQLQDEIAAKLPQPHSPYRFGDDMDAMSPRATEFTDNPFKELLADKEILVDKPPPVPEAPLTPTMKAVDPRSPAQHGISPITRNIFDVL